MAGHIFQHIQDFITGLLRPRRLPTGIEEDTAPAVPEQVTWGDGTFLTWGDGTAVEWSNA